MTNTFGPVYDRHVDEPRLTNQRQTIFDLMKDEQWRTLRAIEDITGFPQASISAQLRHLRKWRFGSHTINRRSKGGTHMYQLVVNNDDWTLDV